MSTHQKIAKSVSIISFATMTSRVLGYIRDGIFAGLFGAGFISDAFLVAYRIPNLLRDLLAEGALSSAFIPVFTEQLTKDGKESAWRLANLLFNLMLIVLSLIVIIGIIFSPYIVHLLQWNLSGDAFDLTVRLTRTVFPFIAFMAFAALLMGILNSHQDFTVSAFAPALLNVVMIITGIFICPLFGERPEQQIVGWAIGALVGGLAQFLIQVPAVLKKGFIYKPILDITDRGVKKIIKLMTPAVFAQSVTQINIIVVNTIMAGLLGKAAITYLYYGNRLMQLPLGVFAVAIATATLPVISRNITKGEFGDAVKNYSFALRLAFLIAIPATVGMVVLSLPINCLLFQYGKFALADAQATAKTAILFSLGLFAFSGVKITVPIFYALNDSKTPVKIGLLTVAVNILLGLILMSKISYFGLALSTSLAAMLNFFLLTWFLRKKLGNIGGSEILNSVMRITVAALVMAAVCWLVYHTVHARIEVSHISAKLGQLIEVSSSIFIGIAAFLAVCWLIKVKELKLLFQMITSGGRTQDSAEAEAWINN
ncbi:MAG: murein biosynthesis integral membrane protein MurJ [Elusimicrobiota bacterium]